MGKLQQGDRAPEFTLETIDGSVNLVAELEKADKGVVVYFYPKAMTPGCTTEACDFRDSENSLKS
ncbi:MAG: redoxin domain-containing protein, partial [Ancrocorticia sp.]